MKFKRPTVRSVVAWAGKTGYPNELGVRFSGRRIQVNDVVPSQVHFASSRAPY
jgi:hypothetical protein